MADKPWENEPLPRAQGQIAPAKWNPNTNEWAPYEVDQRTILVDEEGNPVDLSTPDNQDVTIANPYDDERIKESVDGVKAAVEGIEIPDADYTDITSKLDHLNETIEAKEVDFPEIQKVEVANQQEIPDVEFPDDYPDSTANERLQAIEQTQGQIIKALQTTNESLLATNEHLNSVIEDGNLNTQLNGSNVEDEDAIPIKNIKSQVDELAVLEIPYSSFSGHSIIGLDRRGISSSSALVVDLSKYNSFSLQLVNQTDGVLNATDFYFEVFKEGRLDYYSLSQHPESIPSDYRPIESGSSKLFTSQMEGLNFMVHNMPSVAVRINNNPDLTEGQLLVRWIGKR